MAKKKQEKKYYSCYREGIITSDIVEEEYVHCTQDKIRLPSWYELDLADVKEMISNGVEFVEL